MQKDGSTNMLAMRMYARVPVRGTNEQGHNHMLGMRGVPQAVDTGKSRHIVHGLHDFGGCGRMPAFQTRQYSQHWTGGRGGGEPGRACGCTWGSANLITSARQQKKVSSLRACAP